MAEVMVLFDKELRHLESADAEAWRAWLVQHQLDHISIACPSQLVCKEATRRKPATVTVELLTRDSAWLVPGEEDGHILRPATAAPSRLPGDSPGARAEPP
jgi:hypothetical protein